MTHREIAGIWLIGLAGIAIIIYYHGISTQAILGALGGSQSKPPQVIAGPSVNLGTNRPTPNAGNVHGWLDTFGTVAAGNVQPQGPDTAFKDIFLDLSGQE